MNLCVYPSCTLWLIQCLYILYLTNHSVFMSYILWTSMLIRPVPCESFSVYASFILWTTLCLSVLYLLNLCVYPISDEPLCVYLSYKLSCEPLCLYILYLVNLSVLIQPISCEPVSVYTSDILRITLFIHLYLLNPLLLFVLLYWSWLDRVHVSRKDRLFRIWQFVSWKLYWPFSFHAGAPF